MNNAIKYGAVLIAVYLAAYYGTGAGQVMSASTTGAATVIRAFQGR